MFKFFVQGNSDRKGCGEEKIITHVNEPDGLIPHKISVPLPPPKNENLMQKNPIIHFGDASGYCG